VLLCCVSLFQVIAYNKVDLPDSGDYWEFVKEYLRVSNAPTYTHTALGTVGCSIFCINTPVKGCL
jgi:hypothetical protein